MAPCLCCDDDHHHRRYSASYDVAYPVYPDYGGQGLGLGGGGFPPFGGGGLSNGGLPPGTIGVPGTFPPGPLPIGNTVTTRPGGRSNLTRAYRRMPRGRRQRRRMGRRRVRRVIQTS